MELIVAVYRVIGFVPHLQDDNLSDIPVPAIVYEVLESLGFFLLILAYPIPTLVSFLKVKILFNGLIYHLLDLGLRHCYFILPTTSHLSAK